MFKWIFLLSSLLYAEGNLGFLTSEEISLFHRQGYVLKSGCLSSQEIALMQEAAGYMTCRALAETTQENIIHIDGSRVVFQTPSRAIARINGCLGMCPQLSTVLRSEKMLHTFFELLGTDQLEHLICQYHPKLPGDGVAFPRHQDIQFRKNFDPAWQDILGNGSYAICILPVDPMSEENGGLWVEPEEHPLWIQASPGDLLFIHPLLYHGSGPNTSPYSRRTLLTGFCAFGANHRPYPGAHVNIVFTLQEGGKITDFPAPWNVSNCITETNIH